LYTNKPSAGEVIGAADDALVNVTRGGKNPLSEAETSNLADAWGVVVPMPVWAYICTEIKNKNRAFFILQI
jgi:hypothetical protein